VTKKTFATVLKVGKSAVSSFFETDLFPFNSSWLDISKTISSTICTAMEEAPVGDNLNKKCLQLYGTSGEFRIKNEDKTSIIQGEIDQNQVVMVLINY
jgi:hypothetical protein